VNLELNSELAAVLIRCLNYGAAATSKAEANNGTKSVIRENIHIIRKRLSTLLSDEIIDKTVAKAKKGRV
jgi:hypothetical protein